MNYEIKKPEDLLADSESYASRHGFKIRKGTMAASLANADIVEAIDASDAEKAAALAAIESYAPVLKAFGLTKHLKWKNPIIQQLFES